MRQALGIRYLAVVMLVLFLAGCTETYAYLPSIGGGKSSPPPAPGTEAPAAAQPVPTAEAPAPPPRPDLPQQVQALEARVQQLETRLAELEGRQAAPAPAAKTRERPATLSPSKAAYPAPAAAAAEAKDQAYAEGFRLYQAKKFAQARTKFTQYLKDPKGAKAPEARYYLADSFYQEGKFQDAAVEFNKFVGQHPQSNLAPAALLRQALAYGQQQQTVTYRNTLNKLVKGYPNSKEAKEAQKYLQEGKKEAPAKAPAKPVKPAKPAAKPAKPE